MQEPDPDVAALEALTRVLVGIAWDSAHAAPPGVTFPQIRLLLVAASSGTVTCSHLAATLGVNPSSVTRLADRLKARGYLRRGTDPRNRSVVTIELTERGRDIVAQVLRRRHAALRALLDRIPADRLTATTDSAREVVSAAAAMPSLHSTGPGPL